jgi:hypothetical protein
MRSRRRTGPRGGRCPGWYLPPTRSLDTPPDEQRGYIAAHELDLVPEERDDTGRIARLQSHGDEVDAGRDVSEDLRNAQVIRPVRFLRGRLRTGPDQYAGHPSSEPGTAVGLA